jgi:gas vesicle protein
MQTILIIIGLLAIAAGVGYVLIKKGKIKDSDGDFIPDVVEDKVDEIEAKVQKKVKAVKTRVKNVKDEIEDVVEEIEDVFQAIKGKVTKSKLNSMTKDQLVQAAKTDHNVELDGTVKKSTLVNKVYSLYNNKK